MLDSLNILDPSRLYSWKVCFDWKYHMTDADDSVNNAILANLLPLSLPYYLPACFGLISTSSVLNLAAPHVLRQLTSNLHFSTCLSPAAAPSAKTFIVSNCVMRQSSPEKTQKEKSTHALSSAVALLLTAIFTFTTRICAMFASPFPSICCEKHSKLTNICINVFRS